jgi:glycosyltransferase involved in cell wall biosynthesis
MLGHNKKIIVIQGQFPAISATFILDQITGLIDLGFDVETWATKKVDSDIVHKDIAAYKLLDKTLFLKFPDSRNVDNQNWVKEFLILNRISSLKDIAAFHVHYGTLFVKFQPLFHAYHIPVMVSLHGHDASRYFKKEGDDCYTNMFKRATLITAPSEFIKQKLTKRGCPSDKVKIHRYGINLKSFNPAAPIGTKTNQLLTFLTVGRLVEKKGIADALKAFALIPNKENLMYRIIGEGPLEDSLKQLTCELGIQDKVSFLGAQPRDVVVEEMSKADIFVLTSVTADDGDAEGLPVSIIEAHAMGLPVISTYHSGIQEFVCHGKSGFLSNEKDFYSISEHMKVLSDNSNLRKEFGAYGRHLVEKEYNISQLNLELGSLINSICSSNQQNSNMHHNPKQGSLVNSLLEQAELASIEGNSKEAKKLFFQVLQYYPKHSRAFNNLGVIAWSEKNAIEALSYFCQSIRHDPRNDVALENMLDVWKGLGNIEAAKVFKQAFSKEPKETDSSNFNLDHFGQRFEITKLQERLIEKGWEDKEASYKRYFEYAEFKNILSTPFISIIIIAWQFEPDILVNILKLHEQRDANYQLIFVNNGAQDSAFDVIRPFVDIYVKLNTNTGAYLARNIGALFADARQILFLDDDAFPDDKLVSAHISAYEEYEAVSYCGACFPKDNSLTQHIFKSCYMHYFRGSKPYPSFAYLEGNTSYDSFTFFQVGGWDDEITFGGGGPELAFRLYKHDFNKRKQIYIPGAVIYHNYVDSEEHFVKKKSKQDKSKNRLNAKSNGYQNFIDSWGFYIGREDFLIQRKEKLDKGMGGECEANIIKKSDIALFIDNLENKLWKQKIEQYKNVFSSIMKYNQKANPNISVVIDVPLIDNEVTKCLSSLWKQTCNKSEVIVVCRGDNEGDKEKGINNLNEYCDILIKLNSDTSEGMAKNVGVAFASSPILLFLDYKAMPKDNLLANYLMVFANSNFNVCRGILLPKSNNYLNAFVNVNYNSGTNILPLFCDVVGNVAFNSEIFYKAGGWDENIFYHQAALDLSMRIFSLDPSVHKQLYHPDCVVYLDYHRMDESVYVKMKKEWDSSVLMRAKHPLMSCFFGYWRLMLEKYNLSPNKQPTNDSIQQNGISKEMHQSNL